MGTTVVLFVLFAGAMMLFSSSGYAYNEYSGSQCETCHGNFGGFGEALHDQHLTFTSNCGMCHPGSPGSTPVNTSTASDGTAFSCAGCHGRDYSGTVEAAGLRVFHLDQRGVSCAPCHNGDPSPPMAENVLPPHYTRGDVSLTDSCADNLDNDGDGPRDGSDSDCASPVEESTWGAIKALYEQ